MCSSDLTLMGIKKVKTKEIREVSAASVESPTAVASVALPVKHKQAKIWDGDAKTSARELVAALRNEVRVL